jgi:hypothetical protein
MKEGFRIAEILNRDLTKIWHPVKGAFFNSWIYRIFSINKNNKFI